MNTPDKRLETKETLLFIPHKCIHRYVEGAFLLKDSEVNQRLMTEINNQAEKKKVVKINGKVGLKEKNKLRGVQKLEAGVRIKDKVGLNNEKKKLKVAQKEDRVKEGLNMETEEGKVKVLGGGVAQDELVLKKRPSQLRSKVGRRSRSGFWQVNKELSSRTKKSSNAKLGKTLKRKTERSCQELVQSDTVTQVLKAKVLQKVKLENVGKVLGTQNKERSKLKYGKHGVDKKIFAEGRDLQTSNASREVKPVWKITPNTCGVCSALVTKRHANVWACNACASFFYKSVKFKKSYRPCMVNIPSLVQFHRSYIQFEDKCDTRGTNRTKCQSCRLLKCYEVVKPVLHLLLTAQFFDDDDIM